MCFDVTKVVRSPRCDLGHDEESRNGRDIKIDILDDYILTPDEFRGSSDIYRSTGELRELPGSIWALLGFRGKREGRLRAPQGLVRIGLWGGAPPPPSFSSLFPFLFSYSYYLERGESYSRWE